MWSEFHIPVTVIKVKQGPGSGGGRFGVRTAGRDAFGARQRPTEGGEVSEPLVAPCTLT